ncbi:hypothetical protein TRICI_004439 [Trichomonascus ciferrii]|uniref:Acyl-protein thioesterase 1 n=1 Tax=Trichomonascus ciferrii TaxID=44093 RepID=A0A642V113_9ASCO|nr:hypothetical protein TRICI_004439 [Trichomonascus ciferrii]
MFPAVRIPAKATPSAAVIFLHGLGDSGAGWSFLAEEAARDGRFSNVNFVFPNAPMSPVTLNMGMKMPSWYDILSLERINAQQDEAGVLQSVETLKGLVEEQKQQGIPSERIVIGGFSQGAAVSLATSVVTEQKLGGVVGLSGYLPISDKLAQLKKDVNNSTPYFMGHGEVDDVVKFEYGKSSAEALKSSFGRQSVEFHQYPNLPHSASPQELSDLMSFLSKIIGSK